MKIGKLRTNHLENPVGYLMNQVSFSWVVMEAQGNKAEKAQIKIALDEKMEECVFDTGERTDISSLNYSPELALEEGRRYYWQVSVWDDAGDYAVSKTAYFETPLSLNPAKWITAPFSQKKHPLFRKELNVSKEIVSARLMISGLGVYEAYINGQKVSDEYLAPYYNDYNLWVQYQTYDVTKQLASGKNVLGVMLGNGWYKGRFGFVENMDELYGDTFRLIAKLHITYADGETEDICTEEGWLCGASPVVESSIYDGEIWDSRKEIAGWAEADCTFDGFVDAVEAEAPLGELTPRLSPPVKIMEKIKPVELITTNAGEKVIDFGQEITGWVEFICEEEEGTEVFLQFGEILQQGNFYNENLRSAKAEYHYISNGKKAYVRPHFTFYGFRYMKVTGMEHINLDSFTGCVIYTQMDKIGNITTSNEKLNRLFLNALWGQKGNFLDVPTDCPQRDERMGWTGDTQVFCATANFNMYTPAFYHKFMYDMKLEQDTMGGSVPHVVPDILGQIYMLLHQKEKETDNISVNTAHASCAWSDAATIVPWQVYRAFGDTSLLAAEYDNMKDWTDYIRKVDVEKCGGKYLWTEGFHFADWLALDNYKAGSSFGATDSYYVASVYYYYSASLTAKAAKVLGKDKDAAYYLDLAAHIKEAIQKEYFTATGRLAVSTQTAYVLALYFDLVPGEYRERLITDFENRLKEDDMHLTTGFVGVSYLCPTLSENGMSKHAYTLLLNEDYPSWLYEVNMGATTIWERWNSVLEDGSISDTGMNSLNHYSYGSIVEWMYRYMCGLNVCEQGAGYEKFVVRPYVDDRLDWVEMEYASAKGDIKSSWKKTAAGYDFSVQIPFDTEAEFIFTLDCKKVVINGKEMADIPKDHAISLTKGVYEISVSL